VVQPGAEDPVASQLAAVLVGEHVVRVVRPRAEELPRSERLSGDGEAGQDPVGAVRPGAGRRQDLPEVRLDHPRVAAPASRYGRGGRQLQLLGAEVGDVVLRDVVADRVEERSADDVRGGREVGVIRRIELDEVDVPSGVPDREPGSDAARLPADDRPRGLGPAPGGRPAAQLLQGHRPPADPVREPRGVRNLAERVDVDGGLLRLHRRAPDAEGVLDHVPAAGELDLLRPGDRQVVPVPPDRVVGKELLRARRRRDQAQADCPPEPSGCGRGRRPHHAGESRR